MSKIVQFKDKTTGEEIFPNAAIDSSFLDVFVTKQYLQNCLRGVLVRDSQLGWEAVLTYECSKSKSGAIPENSCIFFIRSELATYHNIVEIHDQITSLENRIKTLEESNN